MAPSARVPRRSSVATATQAAQLDAFIAKYSPDMAKLAKAVLKTMRARLPGAVEMVSDRYNALVIGWCPTERAWDVINSIAVYPRWVNLFFFEGDTLPDPEKLLQGSGNLVRHIRLTSASDLDKPAVKALMAEALKRADPPLDPKAKRRLIIGSISKKQRSRKPSIS
jgi:hypothetical protein